MYIQTCTKLVNVLLASARFRLRFLMNADAKEGHVFSQILNSFQNYLLHFCYGAQPNYLHLGRTAFVKKKKQSHISDIKLMNGVYNK